MQNKTNLTEKQKPEFDRSICMSFFNAHLQLVEKIEKSYGKEMAYDVCRAIIRYGLFQEIPDETIELIVNEPLREQIDRNQKRRANGFLKENVEASKAIITLHVNQPELSQDVIAKQLGVSKGKVNKTLQKYKDGYYDNLDLNLESDLDSCNTNDRDCVTDYTYKERSSTSIIIPTDCDCVTASADHLVHSSEEGAVAPNLADARAGATPPNKKKKEIIDCYLKGMSFSKDNPEIQNVTGLNGGFIYDTILQYRIDMKNQLIQNEKTKSEIETNNEKGLPIPLNNGEFSGFHTKDFSIDKDDLTDMYFEFISSPQDGGYEFQQEFVDEWFSKEYNYKYDSK